MNEIKQQFRVGETIHVVKDFSKLDKIGNPMRNWLEYDGKEFTIQDIHEEIGEGFYYKINGTWFEPQYFEEFNRAGILSNDGFKYLYNVIYPFREKIHRVIKINDNNLRFLMIIYKENGFIYKMNFPEMPNFGDWFKKMEDYKPYTLQDLGFRVYDEK